MVNRSSKVFIRHWSTFCSRLFWEWLLLRICEYSTLRDPLSIPTPSSGRWSLSSSPLPGPAHFLCLPGWGRGQGPPLMGVKSEQMPTQWCFLLVLGVTGGEQDAVYQCSSYWDGAAFMPHYYFRVVIYTATAIPLGSYMGCNQYFKLEGPVLYPQDRQPEQAFGALQAAVSILDI